MADPVAAATHWVHNIDPYALHLWGSFGIRWYGISYLLGIGLGWWLMVRWARRGRLPMTAEQVGDYIVACAIGMVVGGRLGYALFYEPSLFWTTTSSLPWWKLLAVHQGGMASHGGIVGIALATAWWCRQRKQSLAVIGDAMATVGPLGIACGRIANFVNGELWGKPWNGSWAVIFPEASPPVPRHPSQLYAVALEGLIPFAVMLFVHARHRRPGLGIGLFCLLYGLGRFVGEFFREPDAGQPGFDAAHPAILGFMSKGQAFTVPLLVLGAVIVWLALRRPARPELYELRSGSSASRRASVSA
jgi:phosphatidylglycerol:prolipoprotein diacylglycerol transferase